MCLGRGAGGGTGARYDCAEGRFHNRRDRATIQGLFTFNIEGNSPVCCKTLRVGSVASILPLSVDNKVKHSRGRREASRDLAGKTDRTVPAPPPP